MASSPFSQPASDSPIALGSMDPGIYTPGYVMGSTAPPQARRRPGQQQSPQPQGTMLSNILGNRQNAQQNLMMALMGGPEYLDRISQMRMDPSNTWY